MRTLLTSLLVLMLISACTTPQISEDKPYAIKVKEEKSYFQAEKIVTRLKDMGLKAYMISVKDSTDNEKTYYVMVNAVADIEEAKKLRADLEKEFKLKELSMLSFETIKSQIVPIVKDSIKEEKRIVSNTPGIPGKVMDVIKKFPANKTFFIQQISVFNCPDSASQKSLFYAGNNLYTDLPRGISKTIMMEKTQSYAEAILMDNLYGDNITIDVLKLKPDHGLSKIKPATQQAGFLLADNTNVNEDAQYEISAYFADLILNTDDYKFEEKVKTSVAAFNEMKGYRVTIETEKDKFRTYLILTDANLEYVIFCQSVDKTEKELLEILTDIGKSDGMIGYDEFYNSFYTLPEKMLPDDYFICFNIDRIGSEYARNRNYSKWSCQLVGLWSASAIFNNSEKGIWTYGIYDLLNPAKVNYVYHLYQTMFAGSPDIKPDKFYGEKGFLVLKASLGYDWELHYKPSEIHFSLGRYVCMVDNNEYYAYSKSELQERAEILQLIAGGYKGKKDSAIVDSIK